MKVYKATKRILHTYNPVRGFFEKYMPGQSMIFKSKKDAIIWIGEKLGKKPTIDDPYTSQIEEIEMYEKA